MTRGFQAAGRWAFALGVLLGAGLARGDVVNISTIPNFTWYRGIQPAGSDTFNLAVYNTTPPVQQVADFFGYSVALKTLRVSGSGSVAISNIANSTSNPVFTTPYGPVAVTNGPGYTGVTNQNGPDANVLVPSAGANLFSFNITSSDAAGTFQLVVDQPLLLTSYTNKEAVESQFGNVKTADLVLTTFDVTTSEPTTLTWNGGGGNNNFSTAANWSPAFAPNGNKTVVFAGTTRLTPNNDTSAGTTYSGVTFAASAGTFVVGGAKITLAGAAVNQSPLLQTLALPVDLAAGGATFNAAAGHISVTGAIGGAGSLTKTGPMTLTLAAAASHSGNTIVSEGKLIAAAGLSASGGASGPGRVTVAAGATLDALHIRQAALEVAAGATATILANATPTNKAATVSVLTSALASPSNSLRIAAGGVLDLNNNDLIAYYPPGTGAASLSTMQQYIYDGLLNTSGVPQIKFDTGLGSYQTYPVAFDNDALATPWTSWDSQPLTGREQIIVKYTFRGDLDLNGVVDGNDFTVIQQNFGTTGLGLGKGWMKGDADLNGVVDGNDFTIIQQNFGAGIGAPLAPPVGNVVPEPSTLALALLAGLAGLWFWGRR